MKTKIKRHYRSAVSILLSVCMLISCMTVGLIATDAARVTDSESVGDSSTYTVYFANNGDWSNVYYYLFTGENNDGTDWPGHEKTTGRIGTIDGKKVYKFTFSTDRAKIIFNNNRDSQKTGDLDLINGALYNKDGQVGPFSESLLDKAKIYGSVPQASGSWDKTEYDMTYVSPGIYSFEGLAKPSTGLAYYRFGFGGYWFRYGDADGSASQDPSNPTATVRSDAKPDAGAFTLTPEGKDYTVYVDVSDLDNVKTWYQFSYNTNVDFAIIGGLNKLKTINETAPDTSTSGIGFGWKGENTFVTPTDSSLNAIKTGSEGVYSITFKTKTAEEIAAVSSNPNISIGLWQISADSGEGEQRGYYVDGTYYNTVKADYTVPYNGITDGDNCYAVDGTGSILLQPDTEYTLTIDQTNPLDSSNPYGKITVTTNKRQITAVAKVKRRNPADNTLNATVSNASASMGKVVVSPTSDTTGYNTTLIDTTGFNAVLTATVVNTTNYTFAGWYTDKDCTAGQDSTNPKSVSNITSDVTYYALFTENELPELNFTVSSDSHGSVSSISPASGKVFKGGTVTFTATPSSGYVIDEVTSTSGTVTVTTNEDNNNAAVTVSNITADATAINVTFKPIETYTVKLSADSENKGKVSITYFDANGAQQTASDITSEQTFTVQQGKVVSLTATKNSGKAFNGWQIVSGTYQRSKDTPFTEETVNLKPTSDMTIKGLFGDGLSPEGTAVTSHYFIKVASTKTGNYSTAVPLYVKYDQQDGNDYYSEFRSYFTIGDTDDPANGKLKSGQDYWFIVVSNSGDGNISNSNYDADISLSSSVKPSGTSWNNEFKDQYESQHWAVYVNFKSAAKTATVFWGKVKRNTHWNGIFDKTASSSTKYAVDFYVNASSSGGSGTDDTPDKTDAKKIYVLDGIDGDGGTGGTRRFGDTVISKAPSGLIKYKFYNGTDEDALLFDDAGHSEDARIYYYKTTEDLSFRVKTTVDSQYKAIGVRAFVMNGKSYDAKPDKDGSYYADISLPAGDHGTLEIIPVYKNTLMDDKKDCIYFEVDANKLGDSWGKTIGYSAWFKNGGHGVNGAYPGQPLMSNGNILYGYIPKYYVDPKAETLPAASARYPFSGVLLTNLCEHNAIHEDVMTDWGFTITDDNRNYQTFDYEDPVKISQIAGIDTIKYIVKYEETNPDHQTGTHWVRDYNKSTSLNNSSTSTWPSAIEAPTSSDLKGFEILTDIDGNPVDIYGNKLTNGANFDTSVFVVSVGNQPITSASGKNDWDTVWMVYDKDKSFIKANNPAEFINVASTNQLDSLKGKTVYINYEKFLDGKPKDNINSGDRVDGRWLYSKTSDDTTFRLRVATKDASGNLTFLKDNGIDVAEITDGTRNGPIEAADTSNLTKLLEFDNRTTEVTAKINVSGYKVVDFYMLKSSYAISSANNGFSAKIGDYDALNVNGTGYTFKNTKDNRMVIVIEEIPATDLAIFHQEYLGEGAHHITGVYYSKVEMYDGLEGNLINMTGSVKNGSKYGVFTNQLIQLEDFTAEAPKNSGRYLKVTIKTVMPPSAQFYQWYENDHNGGYNELPVGDARGSEDPVETVIWVSVADLYGNLNDNLTIRNLDYYSDLQSGDSINVHHDLTTATKNGNMTGETYVKVTVVDSTGNNIVAGGDLPSKLQTVTVDSSFITTDNAEAQNQLKIEIWTAPDRGFGFNKFHTADNLTDDTKNEMTTGVDGSILYTVGQMHGEYNMATVMVPIDYFFKEEYSEAAGSMISVFDSSKKDFELFSSLEVTAKTLTITKELTSGTDADTTFSIAVTKNGSAYQGAWKLNGTAQTDTTTGIFTVKQKDVITIEELPIGDKISVTETNIPFNYSYAKATLGDADGTNVTTDGISGYSYTVANDVDLKIWNAPKNIKYKIVYTFPSRAYTIGDNKGHPRFGTLSKTVEGTINGADPKIKDYFDTTAETPFITQAMVRDLTPYEKNFLVKMEWAYNDYTHSTEGEGDALTYTAALSATNGNIPTKHVTFYFPYNIQRFTWSNNIEGTPGDTSKRGHTYGPADFGTPTQTDYQSTLALEEANKDDGFGTDTFPYQGNTVVWEKHTATRTKSDGTTETFEEWSDHCTWAAETISGGGTFAYWSIRAQNRNAAKVNGDYPYVEVARCYEQRFNYTLFDDYKVYAIYSTSTGEFAPDTNGKMEDVYATINFLEYSRNHWNNSAYGSYPASYQTKERNIVYTDFDVAFENAYELIQAAGSTTEVGVLVEKVGTSDIVLNPDAADYATTYAEIVSANNGTINTGAIQDFIANSSTGRASNNIYDKRVIQKSNLTNKGRTEYGYALTADLVPTGQTEPTDQSAVKNMLYRAYSYIRIKSTTEGTSDTVVLCETPVYFSIKYTAER